MPIKEAKDSDSEIIGYNVSNHLAGKITTRKTEATKWRIIDSNPNIMVFTHESHDVLIVPVHSIVSIIAIYAVPEEEGR